MRIREVHAAMKESGTLEQNGRNKGVKRQWRVIKRIEALSRESARRHRLGQCGCPK